MAELLNVGPGAGGSEVWDPRTGRHRDMAPAPSVDAFRDTREDNARKAFKGWRLPGGGQFALSWKISGIFSDQNR
jgi:hypothetical protein